MLKPSLSYIHKQRRTKPTVVLKEKVLKPDYLQSNDWAHHAHAAEYILDIPCDVAMLL